MRLHSYLDNGAHNSTGVVDGFLILGDGDPVFDVAQLRTPVIKYMSEAEVGEGVLADDGMPSSSPYLRLWQAAGIARSDTWTGIHLPLRAAPPPPPAALEAGCANGTETPDRYLVGSAVVQLDRWVLGKEAAIQPPGGCLGRRRRSSRR
jgi:hypothetical protein